MANPAKYTATTLAVILECVSKQKLMNYREEGLAN